MKLKRTKHPPKLTRTLYPNNKHPFIDEDLYYPGMEVMQGKVVLTTMRPFKTAEEITESERYKYVYNRHHCLICYKTDGKMYITHRKNTGKWRKLVYPKVVTL